MSNSDARRRVALNDFMRAMLSPDAKQIAMRYIEKHNEDAKYVYYKIKGHPSIFSRPHELGENAFCQVVSETLYDKNWYYYQIKETMVEDGDVVVDCGAAEGLFSFTVLQKARHVYAIEPLPLFVNQMKAMFSGDKKVTILGLAMSDKEGSIYLKENGLLSEVHDEKLSGDIEVPVSTIDKLFYEKGININYLKADLEGHESRMIKGALKTIQKYRPKLAITTYHDNQDYRELVDIIKSAEPSYKFKVKGIEEITGKPMMLHMWRS